MQISQPNKNDIVNLALDTLQKNKQALVFVNTKRSAEKEAEEISRKSDSTKECQELATKIEKTVSPPTKQCIRLANCIKRGIAFHHSGLHPKQKELIEDAFRSNIIKIICCTPTLCISGDTKIWHGCSETEAAKFKLSNQLFVLSKNKFLGMKAQKVEKVLNAEDLVQISSVSGYSIKVTPNHKVLVKRKGKKILVHAKDIKNRDKIATAGKLYVRNPKSFWLKDLIKENRYEGQNYKFDTDLAYFIGVMLGDGYSGAETQKRKIIYKGTPTIVGIDQEVFLKVKEVCEKFGINCRESKTYHGTPCLILGKNKWFREFLVHCGVEKRDKKHIAGKLMNMGLDNIPWLLRGLFDTDGYVEKRGHIGFSNISETLVKQMQKLLLCFGIVCRLRTRKEEVMKIFDREHKTALQYELLIAQKKSVINFYKHVGFFIKRKQEALLSIVKSINTNHYYSSCKKCTYKIHKDIFSGRTKHHKKWGERKCKVIELLGEKGELGSRDIKNILGFEPRKKERRINSHYEIIKKRRKGNRSKTEWYWSLNQIGKWVYNNILLKNKEISSFFELNKCPLCSEILEIVIKDGWRSSDFDGDIFWDMVRNVKKVENEQFVYDIILPQSPSNDHLFVANGFIVHNSAGLDLPCFRAIIRDTKRYGGSFGMVRIPVLEFLQMVGRAGRPKFDDWGEGICLAKTQAEANKLVESYLFGVPESIYSKLSAEPVLRTYLLSLIATGFVQTKEEILDFFSKTFWAHQYKDIQELEQKINNVLEQLKIWGFIIKKGESKDTTFVSGAELLQESYSATIIGKRVAELYLDPLTAYNFIEGLEKAKAKKTRPLSYLQLISASLEIRPQIRMRQKDWDWVTEEAVRYQPYILQNEPSAYELEYESWFDGFKTALLLHDWIEEKTDLHLMETFGVGPGETRVKLQIADWLLYALDELARVKNLHELRKDIRNIRIRVKHGIKEELLPLVKLKNIGRVRARNLYKNNIKSVVDLHNASLQTLSQIVGEKLARDLKRQTSGEEPNPISKHKRIGQMGLGKYE